MKNNFNRLITSLAVCFSSFYLFAGDCSAVVTMNDYCSVPPFIAQTLPPLLMLDAGRDHKLYYQAYNDAADLDGDGKLDIEYNHSIDYYGYFDPYKCYTYASAASQFNPESTTSTKFCSSGQWSGNVLNWMTMSRMDALRRVLYGGFRHVDTSSSTVLKRVYIPNDAHSWGKELTGRLCSNGTAYKQNCTINSDCDGGYTCQDIEASGKYIVPFATATTPTTCTAVATTAVQAGKVLVARYRHATTKRCGVGNSAGMIASYEPANLFSAPSLVTYVDGFEDPSLDPGYNHHGSDYNILAVTTFTADVTGTWQFAVDGDDDVEVQVNAYGATGGTIVAQYLGCHGASGGQTHSGSIDLVAGNKYTIVVRHFEDGGGEGVRVWFRRPGASVWTYVTSSSTTTGATTGLYAPLTLSAPSIASDNVCAIMNTGFVTDGIPQVGTSVTTGTSQRHLFCSTTAGSATPTDEPILRVLTNRAERIWSWSAKEQPVCDNSLGTPTDFSVRVKVCDSSFPESNCKAYGTSLKPTGLLHKYGVGDGTKVCSKNLSKTCTTTITDSSDCATGEGLCVYASPMYFGMMSGSYTNNTRGGVLRKNITSMQEEINPTDGTFTGTNGIIKTFDNFRIATFNGGTYGCGWVTSGAISNGQCNDWGNPLGEILYETLRYFSGKGSSNPDYSGIGTTIVTPASLTISAANDLGLDLPMPSWGYTKALDVTTYQPYDIYPSCSRPFTLLLSDINPSYDSDQIPGSAFATYAEDTATPKLKLGTAPSAASGLATYNSTSLLRAITNLIGTTEGMNGKNWFVGQSNSTNNDNLCTAKPITDLSLVMGMCPEEPTKLGTYYLPALAYYGKTLLKENAGIPNMETYAVALASPVADLKIKVGGNYVTIAPTAKSVSGCLNVNTNCAAKLTFPAYDTTGKGLIIPSSTTAFCPTNQIVNFFVDDIRYDGSDVVYANFRINYEDVEQGADHDMDAIVKYEVCTATARASNYGTCGDNDTTPVLAADQFQVKMSSEYASGCIDQVIGYNLSGTGSTTTDGTYLLVKDADVGDSADGDTPAIISGLPTYSSRIFTASGTASAFLKNPLWYAAKWGAFNDGNSNGIPDLASEWAKNDGVNPDNYYLVVNPLKLEQQLDKALTDILRKTSSGTAASIVNKRNESGANLLTAVFYPQRDFGGTNNKANWIGDLQNYWYYFDPYLGVSGLRENTEDDAFLKLSEDWFAQMYFDTDSKKTMIARWLVTKNSAVSKGIIDVDDPTTPPKALWRAGKALFDRSATDRTIYSNRTAPIEASGIYSAARENFNDGASADYQTYLQATDDTESKKIINYTLGVDSSAYRSRTVTIGGTSKVWKLGDIISSTPKIQSSVPSNSYNSIYGDTTYTQFVKSSNYSKNGMVYVGANDGMFHAFKFGKITNYSEEDKKAKIEKVGDSVPLGGEEWAFIPRNALPYLKYLADPNYNHLYMVDNSPLIVDASINNYCGAANYYECKRQTKYLTTTTTSDLDIAHTSWKTIVIGGMGMGGATRAADGTCASTTSGFGDCVKSPINTTDYTHLGLSSYFAFDVTTPTDPQLLWEFSPPGMGFAMNDPVIVRINGRNIDASSPKYLKLDPATNGRWFALFTSGPTGPINTTTHQMYGRSDQSLKIYVVELGTGKLVKTFDLDSTVSDTNNLVPATHPLRTAPAFGGSLGTNAIDTDDTDKQSPGYYSTDVVYINYVRPKTTSGTTVWNNGSDGGLLRLVTGDNPDPTKWKLSLLIDGAGPVTASIEKQFDDVDPISKKPVLWLYFGSGRYFYRDTTIDAADEVQTIYGIKDPCYANGTKTKDFINASATPAIDASYPVPSDCSLVVDSGVVKKSDLEDSSLVKAYSTCYSLSNTSTPGWYTNLAASDTTFKAERLITTPSTRLSGLLIYTTFKPAGDICQMGGSTFERYVNYRTGCLPCCNALTGNISVQSSTGAVNSRAVTSPCYDCRLATPTIIVPPVTPPVIPPPVDPPVVVPPKIGDVMPGGPGEAGKPPSPQILDDKLRKPVRKILHVLEK